MFVADLSELDCIAMLNVPVDRRRSVLSLEESVIKAMASRLDNFVDMRTIEIRRADSSRSRLGDTLIPADLFAASRPDTW